MNGMVIGWKVYREDVGYSYIVYSYGYHVGKDLKSGICKKHSGAVRQARKWRTHFYALYRDGSLELEAPKEGE